MDDPFDLDKLLGTAADDVAIGDILGTDDARPIESPIGVATRTFRRRAAKRDLQNRLMVDRARAAIERLPDPGETIHMVVAGDYRSWDLVPAMLDLAARPLAHLWIATLSYNREVLTALADLFDSGQIGQCHFLTSSFDKAHDPERFQLTRDLLIPRGHRLMAMRNHCKLLCLDFGDGRQFVSESSANLRSHSTTEQIALTHDRDLYAFHTAWMDEVFAVGLDDDTRTARQRRAAQ
jgi:hypothetical protein